MRLEEAPADLRIEDVVLGEALIRPGLLEPEPQYLINPTLATHGKAPADTHKQTVSDARSDETPTTLRGRRSRYFFVAAVAEGPASSMLRITLDIGRSLPAPMPFMSFSIRASYSASVFTSPFAFRCTTL